MNRSLRDIISCFETMEYGIDDLAGTGFRKSLILGLTSIGTKSELSSIDLEVGTTGIRVDVGHRGAAKGNLLEALLHVAEGRLSSLIFVTQTKALAKSRNSDPERTGNMVYFEILNRDIKRYYGTLITCPVGVLGAFLDE